jgi:cytochrome c biogenesis protein CcdA
VTGSGSLGVLVAFSAGLFSFLSPCVLPLFPS